MSTDNPDVFVVPCDAANFENTVVDPLDLSLYENWPDELTPDSGAESTVPVWAVPPGKSNMEFFEKLSEGDLVLFYDGETYRGVGWVEGVYVDTDERFNKMLWNGELSTAVFTVRDFTELDIPHGAVHRMFGYSSSYAPNGLMRIADSRLPDSVAGVKVAVEKYELTH